MIVDVSTMLDCSAAKAWSEVQKSSLLTHVIWPLARVTPCGVPLPDRWSERATIRCRSLIFGIIPIGVRTLYFEKIDQDRFEIQSREHDPVVARWDHLVSIKAIDESRSVYRDMIDIDAGKMTFLVWAWASWFYRHRQRRWRKLARNL